MNDSVEKNLGYLLNKSTRMLRARFNDKLKNYDLTSPQWAVLKDISVHENPGDDPKSLSPAVIAERLYMDRPTLSGIIDRLAKRSLVSVSVNPKDRRSQIIHLTDKANYIMEDLEKLGDNSVLEALKGFKDEETIKLQEYLSRLIDNLSSAMDNKRV